MDHNLALLFGAELDAELERGRQLQAGIAAGGELKLPLRDTRMVDKNEAKDRHGRRARPPVAPIARATRLIAAAGTGMSTVW